MSYHDRKNYETKWGKAKEQSTENKNSRPRIQVVSPQKMLIDIQAALDRARQGPMTMYELHSEIQRILNGE